jgi:hypothetical protein
MSRLSPLSAVRHYTWLGRWSDRRRTAASFRPISQALCPILGRIEPLGFVCRFNDALAFNWRAKPFLSESCFQLARPWTEVLEMSSSKDFIHGHPGYASHRMFSQQHSMSIRR